MHVLGGVRYRAQDVKRLGLVAPDPEQPEQITADPEPEPVITTRTANAPREAPDADADAGRPRRAGGKAEG